MGSIVTGGALTEMAGRRPGAQVMKLGWPAALATVGWMFFTHAQHGTGEAVERAKRLHQRLGVTLIAAAAGRVASLVSDSRAAKLAWPSLLLLGAAQLVTYREPEGSFETLSEPWTRSAGPSIDPSPAR